MLPWNEPVNSHAGAGAGGAGAAGGAGGAAAAGADCGWAGGGGVLPCSMNIPRRMPRARMRSGTTA
jgi:hypothetical protein